MGDALAPESLDGLDQYTRQIAGLSGVVRVESLVTVDPHLTLADYQRLYADPNANPALASAAARLASGDETLVNVDIAPAEHSAGAEALVSQMRGIQAPAGLTPLVGGVTASQMDLFANLRATIPWALLVIAVAVLTLLFLMTGSLIVPLKALVLNVFSLTATFGALVWIFQDGHLANVLSFQSIGSIDSSQPVLIFAIAFGLSMDYEVFLLSRIKERYDATGDNRLAVASGLQRTGWLITSAAALLAVVIGAFATSKIIFIQEIGVGLAIAVLMDATLVRALLVPATMRLLGDRNWWAPRPLRAIWRRVGVHEGHEGAASPAPAADERLLVHK